jgi:hypothetical protein
MSKHINEFIFRIFDDCGIEMFCATLEEGGLRFGWVGGPMMEISDDHPKYNKVHSSALAIDCGIISDDSGTVESEIASWMRPNSVIDGKNPSCSD